MARDHNGTKVRHLDLSDERFHRKRIPWKSLIEDGYTAREVLKAAQWQGMWKLARSANARLENYPEIATSDGEEAQHE